MNTNTPTPSNTITRRVFIKRTTSTVLAVIVASSMLSAGAYADIGAIMQSVPCNRDANGNVTSYCEIATVNTTQPNEPPFDPKGRAYCDDLKVLGVCTLYGQRECVPANRKDVYAKDGTDLFCVGFQAPN